MNEFLQKPVLKNLHEPMTIGGVEIRNRVFLAPMSGVTDLPFRKLVWRYGAGMVVSEMVASQAFVQDESEMLLKSEMADLPTPMVQIAGCEAKWMAEAARMVEANGAAIIDINMGCPAKRVTNGYSGSALMREPDHALSLIEAVIASVNVPVTLKMRLGWDHDNLNAPYIAKRAEDAGVQMVTVHGRTRCQFYKGDANWSTISETREAISVPLVVNGDIKDATTAETAQKLSGADAVMVGRGAYGAPWLPGYLAGDINGATAQKLIINSSLVIEHYEAMLSFYGEKSGIRQARKHLGWYLDHLPVAKQISDLRKSLLTSFSPEEVISLLKEIYDFASSIEQDVADPVAA